MKYELIKISLFICYSLTLCSQAADIEGDTKIRGKIDIISAVGDSSVFIGANAGINDNRTQNRNTAIGTNTLRTNINGYNNTAIGWYANVSENNLINATAIGASAIVRDSNAVRIGNTDVTKIEGEVAFSASSDKRLKENIRPISIGKAFINDLNPVEYHRKNNSKDDVEAGLIAQELLAVLEKHGMSHSGMVSKPEEPDHYMSVRYNDLLAPIIKAIQELSEENEMLKADNELLKADNNILKAEVSRIDKLERSIDSMQAVLARVMDSAED
jgi:hypothetical protein